MAEKFWTSERVEVALKVASKAPTIREAARELSRIFGREVTRGAVDSLLVRHRHEPTRDTIPTPPIEVEIPVDWEEDTIPPPEPSVEDIRAEHPTGPVLVILDFLQLVSGAEDSNQREDIRERIGGAAYLARMAARAHGATVLILSATARTNYPLFTGSGKADGMDTPKLGTGDPGRFVGTGKEAGEVEYAADGVLALCRAPDGAGRLSWLAVAKARTGRPPSPCRGWVAYGFDGTCFTEDIDATDKPTPAPGNPSGPGAGAGVPKPSGYG